MPHQKNVDEKRTDKARRKRKEDSFSRRSVAEGN